MSLKNDFDNVLAFDNRSMNSRIGNPKVIGKMSSYVRKQHNAIMSLKGSNYSNYSKASNNLSSYSKQSMFLKKKKTNITENRVKE